MTLIGPSHDPPHLRKLQNKFLRTTKLINVTLHQHFSNENLFLTEDGQAFLRLPACPVERGYHQITVPGGGKSRKARRHTLVLETFSGPSAGRVARHKDGNPGNDHKSNLEWGSQFENCQDTVVHGRTTKGEKNSQAKLTEVQVIEIKRRLHFGECQSDIAAEMGVGAPTVSNIATGKTWAHVQLPNDFPGYALANIAAPSA